MSEKVYIIGVGSTALGRFSEKSVKDLTREAVTSALKDASAQGGSQPLGTSGMCQRHSGCVTMRSQPTASPTPPPMQ